MTSRKYQVQVNSTGNGLLDALAQPYHGLTFRFDKSKDWYLTDDGCAANPVLAHPGNPTGVKIKIQVSTRERPIRPVHAAPLRVWSMNDSVINYSDRQRGARVRRAPL